MRRLLATAGLIGAAATAAALATGKPALPVAVCKPTDTCVRTKLPFTSAGDAKSIDALRTNLQVIRKDIDRLERITAGQSCICSNLAFELELEAGELASEIEKQEASRNLETIHLKRLNAPQSKHSMIQIERERQGDAEPCQCNDCRIRAGVIGRGRDPQENGRSWWASYPTRVAHARFHLSREYDNRPTCKFLHNEWVCEEPGPNAGPECQCPDCKTRRSHPRGDWSATEWLTPPKE